MSGVVAGQVFTDKELDRLLAWYEHVRYIGIVNTADAELAEKIRNDYNNAIACRV